MSNQNLTVTGVVYYASLMRPNPVTEVYSIDLVVDDKTSTKLKAAGLVPSKKQDGSPVEYENHKGDVYRFKRKSELKDGSVNTPPVVVDSKNKPITDYVGNGSKVNAAVNIYEWTFKSKKGVSGGLRGVQVVDLVEFKSSPLFTETEGFETEESTEDTSVSLFNNKDEDII